MQDHLYSPTAWARCRRCGGTLPEHPTVLQLRPSHYVPAPEPPVPDECGVDHESLNPWARCPSCYVWHEPKLATGELTGPPHAITRGPATPRFLRRVLAYVGWAAHRGELRP